MKRPVLHVAHLPRRPHPLANVHTKKRVRKPTDVPVPQLVPVMVEKQPANAVLPPPVKKYLPRQQLPPFVKPMKPFVNDAKSKLKPCKKERVVTVVKNLQKRKLLPQLQQQRV